MRAKEAGARKAAATEAAVVTADAVVQEVMEEMRSKEAWARKAAATEAAVVTAEAVVQGSVQPSSDPFGIGLDCTTMFLVGKVEAGQDYLLSKRKAH